MALSWIILLLNAFNLIHSTQIEPIKFFNTKMSAIYFKSFTCELSLKYLEPFIYPNVSCGVKNYGRKISTFYGYVVLKKPVHKFYFQTHLSFKSGNKLKEVLGLPKMEICSLLKSSTSIPVIKEIVNLMRTAAPSLVHECPYKNVVEAYNITIYGNSLVQLAPVGDYRLIIPMWVEDLQPEIGKLIFEIYIRRTGKLK